MRKGRRYEEREEVCGKGRDVRKGRRRCEEREVKV